MIATTNCIRSARSYAVRSYSLYNSTTLSRRFLSDASAKSSKRYLQTINQALDNSMSTSTYIPLKENSKTDTTKLPSSNLNGSWSKHTLPSHKSLSSLKPQDSTASPAPQKKRRRQLKPRKALITLTPNAIYHLRQLLDQPEPKYVKVGVKNRGCSGLSYHLEYVDKPEKFDEIVKVDDIMVIIDSKALFSIIGSQMDYVEDKLSSRFVFKNPNSKGSCGCGESFMV